MAAIVQEIELSRTDCSTRQPDRRSMWRGKLATEAACESTNASVDSIARRTYGCRHGLRSIFCEFSNVPNLSVVLFLDRLWQGRLSAVIERSTLFPAGRLILTSVTGRLPGVETIADLAVARASLGWQEILFERESASAIQIARETLRPGEAIVLLLPAPHEIITPKTSMHWLALFCHRCHQLLKVCF